nr:membrane protein insertion efficiency factor YidD [Candidatus Bandiella woodruffii]
MKGLCLMFLAVYQNMISPYMAPSCRYYPSCSNYAKEAVKEFGIKGIFLTFKRILRCSPFSKGGYDPIPQKSAKTDKYK